MSAVVAAGAALVVGAVATQPIAEALSPHVVGSKVPGRIQDLVQYLVEDTKPNEKVVVIGPDGADIRDSERVRVLGAIGLGAGVAVAAIVYVILRRAFP